MPLVSVIVNIRNGSAFLRDALDSVIAQGFTDWELIAWDDRSTDNSAQIVAEYGDPRVHYYLSPAETPLGKARDLAIRQSRGEWLAFIDQDDLWLPNKLEKQIALAAPDVGLIYGRTLMFDRRGELRDYDYAHEFECLPEGEIFQQLFRHGCFIAMSSAMLRRSAVEQIGGIPDEIQVVPDYFLYTAIAHRYRARAVQDVICRYRVHAASMSASPEHRRRLYTEPLAIIDRWAGQLDPKIVAHRRRANSTALALQELRQLNSAPAGLRRLLTAGSVLWLSSRPCVRAWRVLHRTLRRPYHKAR